MRVIHFFLVLFPLLDDWTQVDSNLIPYDSFFAQFSGINDHDF